MAKRRGRAGGSTRGTRNRRRTVLAASTKSQKARKGAVLVRHFAPSAPGSLTTKTGKPTAKAKVAPRWGEPTPRNRQQAAKLHAKGKRLLTQARR